MMLAHLLSVEVGATAELVDGARALARSRDLRPVRWVWLGGCLANPARGISGLVQCRRHSIVPGGSKTTRSAYTCFDNFIDVRRCDVDEVSRCMELTLKWVGEVLV